jgi:hypothetical protein
VVCENTLLGIGRDATRNLYSTAGFTNSLQTAPGALFRANYAKRFGSTAPVPNRFGVSCYEGLYLLVALAQQAGCLNLHKMQAASDELTLATPRGDCRMRANHLGSEMHIVKASGSDLAVIDTVGYRAATTESITLHSPTVAGHA